MRIIDADRLRNEVIEWMPPDPCGIEERSFPYETDVAVSLIIEIDEAPTIKTKQIKYFDEDEKVWKIGEVIVNSSEKPNNCEKECFLCKWLGDVDVCGRCRKRNLFAEADTEPQSQTERHLPDYSYEADLGRRIMEQMEGNE